jgi:hypothetical protein
VIHPSNISDACHAIPRSCRATTSIAMAEMLSRAPACSARLMSAPAQSARDARVPGPAGPLLELVGACLAAAVANVHARLGEDGPAAPNSAASEGDLEEAAAWIATALDCRAVAAYSFEPGADPVHAW